MKNLTNSYFYKFLTLISVLLLSLNLNVLGQNYRLPLYNGDIPGFKPSEVKEQTETTDITIIRNISFPEIAVYLPTKMYSTKQCVVICPGGGYVQLSWDLEGTDIASFLNSIGVAAVILKYRLPSAEYCTNPSMAPLTDARRAMRLVRGNAANWNIDTDKIGIMGFSAGGHLASTLGTHFDYGNKNSGDPVERQSCRPDFMILGYPFISIVSIPDSIRKRGSGNRLLGKNATWEMMEFFSSELQVTKDTPPTFFIHADNDERVSIDHTLLMYKALRENKIPAEVHILSEGGHGFGLATNNDHVNSWTNSLKLWLRSLSPKTR